MRTQIQIITSNEIKIYKYKLLVLNDKNITLKIILIKIILAYSAIKIRANPTLPYSILNPETNSDSPSAKSKGVRLVSATQEINQIPTIGINIKNLYQKKFNFIITHMFNDILNVKKNINIKANLTS